MKSIEVAPPPRQSLAQYVAVQLLDLIRSGTLAEGQKLPSESELKESFGVGRSTIREALNGLVTIGAIEVRHGQGAFVLSNGSMSSDGAKQLNSLLHDSETRELLEAREANELAVARYAAERATEDDLQRLRASLERAEYELEHEGAAVFEAANFHVLLAEAAKNSIFVQFAEMILSPLRERGEDMREVREYQEWELDAHRRLCDAVASGDGDRAAREMMRHLKAMRHILLEGWASYRLTLTDLGI